jgi:hypothetical protein
MNMNASEQFDEFDILDHHAVAVRRIADLCFEIRSRMTAVAGELRREAFHSNNAVLLQLACDLDSYAMQSVQA